MAERHSSYITSKTRFQRVSFLKFSHRRTVRQRGQTMTEYALIIAYVSLFTLQALQNLAFITTKEYVYTNCSLIVGNMQGQNSDSQMSAVDTYLSDPNSWKHADASKIASAVAEIHNTMHTTIYGY
jgi:Flp pilus assembly pilin Flp